MNHGAVFGDHAIDKMQVASHPSQLVEDPTGHQYHDNAARPRGGDRGTNRGIQGIRMGDGAVVVEREHGQLHGGPRARSSKRPATARPLASA